MTERAPSPDPLLVVSARRLIKAYRPRDVKTRTTPDKLSVHITVDLLWREIFAAACAGDIDLNAVADLSNEVLKIAIAAGEVKGQNWYHRNVQSLLWQMDDSYAEYFIRGDQSQDAEKRNLFAFTARLTVGAGMTACPMLFFRHFDRVLEPPENEFPAEIDMNDLIILADYFRITGAWMEALFGIVPTTREFMQNRLTYTKTRWEMWKLNLQRLAERSSSRTVRASIGDILRILEAIS